MLIMLMQSRIWYKVQLFEVGVSKGVSTGNYKKDI